MIINHRLGNFAALYAAGVLTLKSVIHLVTTRAQLMATYLYEGTHGMLSVSSDVDFCSQIIEEVPVTHCDIACLNTRWTTVLSGPVDELLRLKYAAGQRKVIAILLGEPYAFHSRQMDAITAQLGELATSVPLAPPTIAYASTLHGYLIKPGTEMEPQYIAKMTRSPILFHQAAEACASAASEASGQCMWIEIGPGSSCTAMARAAALAEPSLAAASLSRNASPWKTISGCLAKAYQAGVEIDWTAFHADFEREHLELLDLPI